SQRSESRIACSEALVERTRSVSSMRNRNWPPCSRAKHRLNSAIYAVPTCGSPVGDGAIRVRTVMIYLGKGKAADVEQCGYRERRRLYEHTAEYSRDHNPDKSQWLQHGHLRRVESRGPRR